MGIFFLASFRFDCHVQFSGSIMCSRSFFFLFHIEDLQRQKSLKLESVFLSEDLGLSPGFVKSCKFLFYLFLAGSTTPLTVLRCIKYIHPFYDIGKNVVFQILLVVIPFTNQRISVMIRTKRIHYTRTCMYREYYLSEIYLYNVHIYK